jgi:hypothetical protein
MGDVSNEMATSTAYTLKQLQAALKGRVAAPSKLTFAQALLKAAALRCIDETVFCATQQAFLATKGLRKATKSEVEGLRYPEQEEEPTHPVSAKRTRPDVALRRKEASMYSTDVVTCTWSQLCKASPLSDAMAVAVEDALEKVNKVAFEAYELAGYHVTRLLEQGKSAPALSQTFFYRCITAVCVDGSGKAQQVEDKDLQETAREFASWRPAGYNPVPGSGMRCFAQTLSQQMATNCSNMVLLNFQKRLWSYLARVLDGCSAQYRGKIIRAIMSKNPSREDEFVQRMRSMLPMPPSDSNLSSHPHAFLPLMMRMNKALEGTAGKSYSMLPRKGGFTTQFIKINTNTLRQLLIDATSDAAEDDLALPSEEEFLKDRSVWWRKLFKVEKLETTRRKFAYELLTDGRSVKVVMRKPAANLVRMVMAVTDDAVAVSFVVDKQPSQLDPDSFDEVWGLDPGRRDMFVACNSMYQAQKCSSAEFYNVAKYTHFNAKNKIWLSKAHDVRAIIQGTPVKRTSSSHRVKVYAQYMLEHYGKLSAFYGARRYRNARLTRHVCARKKLQALCKELTSKAPASNGVKRTLVGFGDWSAQGGGIRGRPGGPTKRFRNTLKQYAHVIDVDEYCTSKVCNCCKQKSLHNMHKWTCCQEPGLMRRVKVHGVLHCSTSGCLSKTVNRDINASRNILELTLGILNRQDRPACFTRPKKELQSTSCPPPPSTIFRLLEGGADPNERGKAHCFALTE